MLVKKLSNNISVLIDRKSAVLSRFFLFFMDPVVDFKIYTYKQSFKNALVNILTLQKKF